MSPVRRRTAAAVAKWTGVAVLLGLALTAGGASRPAAGAYEGASGGAPCRVSAEDFRTVTALLDRWVERRRWLSDVPGLALGLVCGTDRNWARGFGVADPEAALTATDTTRFRIASISKVFTALAVMQLRDEGRLDLDERVDAYLPWFRPSNAEGMPPVTLRHLLTHTSGLPTNSSATDFNRMTQPTADSMIARLGSQRLVFPPGSDAKYSNLGFAILGQVISAVSERSYGEQIERHLLAPVGMTHTEVHPAPGDVQAAGYHARQPDRPRRRADFLHLAAFTPAGGLATTARDMVALMSFVLAPDAYAIVGLESMREMQQVQHEVDPAWGGFGLAWAVERGPDTHVISHGGGLPTQTAEVRIDLEGGFGAAALTNAMDADASAYTREALALLRLAAAAGDIGCDGPASGTRRYTGRYRWQDWETWVVALGGCLWLIDPVGLIDPLAGRPSASAIRLETDGQNRLRALSGWVGGEPVEFIPDSDGGSMLRLHLPTLMYRRIGEVGR